MLNLGIPETNRKFAPENARKRRFRNSTTIFLGRIAVSFRGFEIQETCRSLQGALSNHQTDPKSFWFKLPVGISWRNSTRNHKIRWGIYIYSILTQIWLMYKVIQAFRWRKALNISSHHLQSYQQIMAYLNFVKVWKQDCRVVRSLWLLYLPVLSDSRNKISYASKVSFVCFKSTNNISPALPKPLPNISGFSLLIKISPIRRS